MKFWVQTDTGVRRVTYDAAATYPVAISQSGDKLAYAVPDGKPVPDGAKPSMLVVTVSAAGESGGKFAPEDSYFDSLEWIDDSQLGIMMYGHANWFYWVVDSKTGKTLHQYRGGFDFLWSHDRRYVARRGLAGVTASKRTFKFAVEGSKLHEIAEHTK